jgi:MFS family permease
MVADLLPPDKRAQGFAILRVTANLAITIGPAIGGLLAARSFLLLFICDTVFSLITAGIVFRTVRETKPSSVHGEAEQTVAQTFGGYRSVLLDLGFALFVLGSVLIAVVYIQMNTTLGVYLRDTHGVSEKGFGYILSLNAGMVVLLQFAITRWISRYRPLIVMAVGAFLYAVGFGLFGVVATYALFLIAMVVITLGEMVISPTSQAMVARMAPEDKRGRYMAIYGFSWILAGMVGPFSAGLVIDNADPRWVWYGAFLVGSVAAAGFLLLQAREARLARKSGQCPESSGGGSALSGESVGHVEA